MIGPQCSSPYPCAFKDFCWKHVPSDSVFDLYRCSGWKYWNEGVRVVSDIAEEEKLSKVNERIRDAVAYSKPYFNGEKLRKALSEWKGPLAFLDFETMAPAIPLFDDCRPYQAVPFQFSVHFESDVGELRHREYLHSDLGDPRRKLATRLIDILQGEGAIVAYNCAFERKVLLGLANALPDLASSLVGLSSRLVDPLPLIRDHVYHKEFGGSFSLKRVAPALLGKDASYEGLNVQDGETASFAYEASFRSRDTAGIEALSEDLMLYCKMDTEILARLVAFLRAAKESDLTTEIPSS